jgi:hypothetical protein
VAEIPDIQKLSEAHPDDLVIIGVSVDEAEADAAGFAEENGLTYPIAMDEGYLVAGELYPTMYIPESVFIAPDGTIAPSSATDEPQWLPGHGAGATGWKRLVALTEPGREAATDLKFGTFWRTERLPASVRVDFAGENTLRSCRVIWRDCGMDVERGASIPYGIAVQVPKGGTVR